MVKDQCQERLFVANKANTTVREEDNDISIKLAPNLVVQKIMQRGALQVLLRHQLTEIALPPLEHKTLSKSMTLNAC